MKKTLLPLFFVFFCTISCFGSEGLAGALGGVKNISVPEETCTPRLLFGREHTSIREGYRYSRRALLRSPDMFKSFVEVSHVK